MVMNLDDFYKQLSLRFYHQVDTDSDFNATFKMLFHKRVLIFGRDGRIGALVLVAC